MAYVPNHRQLPDGSTIYDTLFTAKRLGTVPSNVPAVAERHKVARFAGKARGGVCYYYLAEDVERARAERADIQPVLSGDEIVPAPYVKKDEA